MSGTTLSVCEAGLELANKALVRKGWSKQTLASKTVPSNRSGQWQGDPISYRTVQNFFNRKAISLPFFYAICNSLELDCQVVAGLSPETEEPKADEINPSTPDDRQSGTSIIVQNIGQNNGNVIGQVNGSFSLENFPSCTN